MCLESQRLDDMCKCGVVCPICHVFTTENLKCIDGGGSIKLHSLAVFIEAAKHGCSLCRFIVDKIKAIGIVS